MFDELDFILFGYVSYSNDFLDLEYSDIFLKIDYTRVAEKIKRHECFFLDKNSRLSLYDIKDNASKDFYCDQLILILKNIKIIKISKDNIYSENIFVQINFYNNQNKELSFSLNPKKNKKLLETIKKRFFILSEGKLINQLFLEEEVFFLNHDSTVYLNKLHSFKDNSANFIKECYLEDSGGL